VSFLQILFYLVCIFVDLMSFWLIFVAFFVDFVGIFVGIFVLIAFLLVLVSFCCNLF